MASSTGIADLRVVAEPCVGLRRRIVGTDRKVRLWLKLPLREAHVTWTITVRNNAATRDIFMVMLASSDRIGTVAKTNVLYTTIADRTVCRRPSIAKIQKLISPDAVPTSTLLPVLVVLLPVQNKAVMSKQHVCVIRHTVQLYSYQVQCTGLSESLHVAAMTAKVTFQGVMPARPSVFQGIRHMNTPSRRQL